MGSVGDHENDNQQMERNSTFDHSDTETQPFDSPPSEPGEKIKDKDFNELQFLQSTMPFVDSLLVEDAFDTQVLNLAGETQVLDLDGVENINTQLIDECDTDIVDTDGKGIDRTEVLRDNEELSDNDSIKRVGSYPLDQENNLDATVSKQGDRGFKADSNCLINGQHNSGYVRRNFTSVRVEALRASGLAARRFAFKGTNNEPCFIKSDSQSSKQHPSEDNGIAVIRDSFASGEEGDWDDLLGKHHEQMKALKDENKCKVVRSAVRRLFMDDTLTDIERPSSCTNNADGGADLPRHACGNEIAVLSYVDSPEPGESSQANALGFVDRFLKFDVINFDRDVDIERSTGGKSKPVSSTKLTQSLAKRTNLKITAGERGIFDWDGNHEDGGGGELLTKKEAFFDNGGQKERSFTQPGKLSYINSKGNEAVDGIIDKEEQAVIHQKTNDFINSSSGLVFLNSDDKKAKETGTKSKKNLTKELDEQLNISSSDEMEATGTESTDRDREEMNVGFDTQMAAEAMEALCFGLDMADHDNKDANQGMNKCSYDGEKENRAEPKKDFLLKKSISSSSGVSTRNSEQTKSSGTKVSKRSTISSWKQAENASKQCDAELLKAEVKKSKSNAGGRFATNWIEGIEKVAPEVIEQTEEEITRKRNVVGNVDRCHTIASSSGRVSVRKQHLQEEFGTFTPVACRTRQRKVTTQLKTGIDSYDSREDMSLTEASTLNYRRQGDSTGGDTSTTLSGLEIFSKLDSNQSGELKKIKLINQDKSHLNITDKIAVRIIEFSYNKGRRTHRKFSGRLNGSCNLHGSGNQLFRPETNGQSLGVSNSSKTNALSSSIDLGMKRKTWSCACVVPVSLPSDRQSKRSIIQQCVDKGGSENASLKCNSVAGNVAAKDVIVASASNVSNKQSDLDPMIAGKGTGENVRLEVSLGDRCKASGSTPTTTRVNCVTPISALSPISIGDEYLKQSCRKNLSRSLLTKEINSLISKGAEPSFITKYSRRRRDLANVRVLFSYHLDEDIIKQQQKILARLGVSKAFSMSDATHFVADKFVRTKNMLEAIAFGKPVVTHLWLESCGQASCFVDERNYILRDAKKEKEFGFTLPTSLTHACQHPLLQGQKVLITPNTKPSKDILGSLVKAVHGLAVERIGRSTLEEDKVPDDLLVLSCEEDYSMCLPFLEKGAAVYSSELLLSGIITQKLDYDRHRLFAESVKRTRSTVWLKQDNN